MKNLVQYQDSSASAWGGKRDPSGRHRDPDVDEVVRRTNYLLQHAEAIVLPRDLRKRIDCHVKRKEVRHREILEDLMPRIQSCLESGKVRRRPLKKVEARRIAAGEYGVKPESVRSYQQRRRHLLIESVWSLLRGEPSAVGCLDDIGDSDLDRRE